MQNDFIHYPEAFGFVTSRVTCCGAGPYNEIGRCTLLSNLCTNRDIYAFWDAFHPTECANVVVTQGPVTTTTRLHDAAVTHLVTIAAARRRVIVCKVVRIYTNICCFFVSSIMLLLQLFLCICYGLCG
ncbi:hypothetical protein Droror1_Dr00015401 [Drosera rotundifolia]